VGPGEAERVWGGVSDWGGVGRGGGERVAPITGDGLMQYLVSVIDDRSNSATESEMEDIRAFNRRMQADGHWVFAGGLDSPGTATVVDNRGGEAMFSDGPFLESKEYVAGFWVIEAPDLDVALKLAAEGSKECNRKVEVRPFL
jgi:hypothetical protein